MPPTVANRPLITARYPRPSPRRPPRWLPTAVVATSVPSSTDSRNTIRPPVVPFNMHELSFVTRHRMNHISAVPPVRHSLFPSPLPPFGTPFLPSFKQTDFPHFGVSHSVASCIAVVSTPSRIILVSIDSWISPKRFPRWCENILIYLFRTYIGFILD